MMPIEYLIRPATIEDASMVRELRLEAMQRSPEAFSNDYDRTLQTTVQDWQARIQGSPGESGQITLAWRGDALVGMAGVRRELGLKTRHNGMIWGVYVTPSARGQGLRAGWCAPTWIGRAGRAWRLSSWGW